MNARGLVGAVGVDDATELRSGFGALHQHALVGHHADFPSVNAPGRADEGLPEFLLEFSEFAAIQQTLQQGSRVVGFTPGLGQDAEQLLAIQRRHARGGPSVGPDAGSVCPVGRQFTQQGNGLPVVLDNMVYHTGDAAVHVGASKALGVDILSDGARTR